MKSMTGYGSGSGKVGKGEVYLEIKSINHRFCEINFRLPPKMGALESHLRKEVQRYFERGKIEFYIRENRPLFGDPVTTVDTALAKSYRSAFKKIRAEVGGIASDDFLQYVSLERFIHVQDREGSYEKLWGEMRALLKKVIRQVEHMRIREGAYLKKDQVKRVRLVEKLVAEIHHRSAKSLEGQVERMKKKMLTQNHSVNKDEVRMQQEIAYLGSRQDIAEEITRLGSHVKQYEKMLQTQGAVGRKLDFLLQEMHREINTIGTKANDAHISKVVVDCKAELERLREQIQNIE